MFFFDKRYLCWLVGINDWEIEYIDNFIIELSRIIVVIRYEIGYL